MAAKKLFTIGYAGISPRAFLKKLRANNIAVVIDVRSVPHSRKRGFSKSKLNAQLKRAGISYFNFKDLGSPAAARKKLKTDKDFEAFARSYATILDTQRDIVGELYALAIKNRCCLLCYEAEATMCHRSLVSAAVSNLNGREFTVKHL
jgi:uncharacterized protein (DUF488 family)